MVLVKVSNDTSGAKVGRVFLSTTSGVVILHPGDAHIIDQRELVGCKVQRYNTPITENAGVLEPTDDPELKMLKIR